MDWRRYALAITIGLILGLGVWLVAGKSAAALKPLGDLLI